MLELKNLSFSVPEADASKEIVRDVSLNVPDGNLIVITGPNGGGKSTLARLISGVERPTAGKINFHGEDITDLSVTERAQKGIAFAFQQPVRFKGIRVQDLLKLAAGKTLAPSDACDYLSRVGLCARDYLEREVNASLSGGELKRIEIASVLARNAALSIFDEPEAGIDLWSFQNLIEAFSRMRDEIADRSIIVISHQERILEIADRIVVIREGVIAEDGARDEVLPKLIGTASAVEACRKGAVRRDGEDA